MLKRNILYFSLNVLFFLPFMGFSQFSEKIVFNNKDSANDYYLAVRPSSGNIQGVQVLITSFSSPENVLGESKLQNVAYANDVLTIIVSMGTSLFADSASIDRLNIILKHVTNHYSADTSKFALGGFLYTGNMALRYTELCYENPSKFPVLPKAVFTINSPVDLLDLAVWCENEIKKNYYAGDVGDAKYILKDLMDSYGNYKDHPEKYIQPSPFNKNATSAGNEQFLNHVAVRLYYDTDIEWELKNRRNSYYDTYIPDGSELVKRLLLAGNKNAAFISSKQPGIKSSGQVTPYSWSIVDEVDCIQWLKNNMKIFNPQTFSPSYQLAVPEGWSIERFSLPPDFAKDIPYQGVEDIRFASGWADVKTDEYWAYAFLWWIDGQPEVNTTILEKSLKSYYNGLIARNVTPRKIPESKLIPTVVNIHPVKTEAGDLETFEGTINMLDYMAQIPMVLNARIHKKNCPDKNHEFVLFEISPKPANHTVWQKLNKLNLDFQCVK